MADHRHSFGGIPYQRRDQRALPGTCNAHNGNDDIVLAASHQVSLYPAETIKSKAYLNRWTAFALGEAAPQKDSVPASIGCVLKWPDREHNEMVRSLA